MSERGKFMRPPALDDAGCLRMQAARWRPERFFLMHLVPGPNIGA